MKRLRGRTAIVTGASRGIGPYICRVLAAEGTNVVLAARSVAGLDAAVASLTAPGVRTLVVPADVAHADSRDALIAAAAAEFGEVDVLVNNAGVEFTSAFHEAPPERIAEVLRVNLEAPVLLSRAVLPAMLERRRGHIVNVASLAGLAPVPLAAAYAASKAGLVNFTRSLHSELRGTGVGASVVSPGYVSDAGMFHEWSSAQDYRPPRLLGTSSPERVANAVVSAIRTNKPDVIVNRLPMRPLLALGELAPALGIRLVDAFKVRDSMAVAADHHRRRAAGETSTPHPPGPSRGR